MSLLRTPLLSCDGRTGSAHVTMGDGPALLAALAWPCDWVQHAGIAPRLDLRGLARLGEHGDLTL